MRTLRFLHLSDLHLDTNLSVISHKEQFNFQHSPYVALENFLQLCRKELPDFIIFSGDIYNTEEASLKARLTLKNAFEELSNLKIPIYCAHGNHDPLTVEASTEFSSIAWPSNVHIFGSDWEYFSFPPTDQNNVQNAVEPELARIYGISHTSKNESKNLLSQFSPKLEHGINIGVLHTSLTTPTAKNKGHEHYAPCSEKELQEKQMDYWALGHVHNYTVVSEEPLIVFSGSAQGLNINELGSHGCVMVEISYHDDGHISKPKYTFYALAPVEWHLLDVKLPSRQEVDSITKVQKIITKAISDYVQKLTISPHCQVLAFRIKLQGNSDVSSLLKEIEVRHELCNSLEKSNVAPKIFVLGEVFRVSSQLRKNERAYGQLEKEATELLKNKILRYTSNIKEKNKLYAKSAEKTSNGLLDRAEEISVEVFEPSQQ